MVSFETNNLPTKISFSMNVNKTANENGSVIMFFFSDFNYFDCNKVFISVTMVTFSILIAQMKIQAQTYFGMTARPRT